MNEHEQQQHASDATAVIEPSFEELRAQLVAATEKAEDNHNKFLLAMADFENYRKRMQRDIESIVSSHRRMLLERLLPVADNLERALRFDGAGEGFRGGVEQTLKGFEAVLAAEGVRAIDVAGKTFDPRVAEAIGTLETDDPSKDELVIEVAQKGYTLGEELLRPAHVLVAKKME